MRQYKKGYSQSVMAWSAVNGNRFGNRFRAIVIIMLCFTTTANGGDWRQFRGNAANSVAVGEKLPTELSGGTIAWQVELPGRGVSGPIAVAEQVLVTASSGYSQDRLHVMSFDAETGELVTRS